MLYIFSQSWLKKNFLYIRKNLEVILKINMNYIDLFCWAWWLSLWFDRQWFSNLFSIDFDDSCALTYAHNFPNHNFIHGDIHNLSEKKIKEIIGNNDVDIILWWPPCQWFSMAWNIWRNFVDDPRNHLFLEFVRVVSIVKPKFFLMENVARLYTHNNWKTKAEIIKKFNDIWYRVSVKIMNVVEFWVPQKRSRVIFFWTNIDDINLDFPKWEVKNYKTIKEAIWHFPPLKSGESSNIINHEAMTHTQDMLEKMSYVKDWGNRNDIPKSLRPQSWDIRKYIRYNSNEPSICITGDMRKVFHYSQNRALTVRELAAIQTFPDNFEFMWSKISQQQQVGNAVPPLFAEKRANHIGKMINNIHKNRNFKKWTNEHKLPKINYIWNKEKLSDWIISKIPDWVKSVFDAFSWWCSVSYECKKNWYKVISNDILKVNYLLAKSLIENSKEILDELDLKVLFEWKPFKWFVYKNYANKYYFDYECMELDLYLKNVKNLNNEYKQALAYSLIRRAMIRKMPYSRFNLSWDKIQELRDEELSYQKYKRRRAYHNLPFKDHILENLEEYNQAIFDNWKKNIVYNENIFDIINKVDADLIYLDPPYTGTMNDYFWFYWVIDDCIIGKKTKPFDDNFVDKSTSLILFEKLFSKLWNYKYWLLSYNNSSFPDMNSLVSLLKKYSKKVEVFERQHDYQITWKKNKKTNIEYLFLVKNF